MTTAERWSYSTGERGRNRVRVFEDGARPLLVEFYEAGRRKRVSLGHRDRRRAKQQADEMAAALGRGTRPTGGDLTLAMLFDNYLREVTPAKSESKQRHDRATVEMLFRFFGPDRRARTLNRRDWDRFIQERLHGAIAPAGARANRGVGPRSVEYDLRFLMAVLNWATRAADDRGEPLLIRNPLTGLPVPKEESPLRPVMTQAQYAALLDAAVTMDWRFRLALTLAHETGHRIGAVRVLRWSDIDLGEASVRWRGENDKIGFTHVTPLTEVAVDALRSVRRTEGVIGDTWIFRSPGDPCRPCSRYLMQNWWEAARRRAGLAEIPRLGWHALRRKFASELKHTPLRDVCELGGWKTAETVLTCYQRPDEVTMREALRERRALADR